MKKIINDIKLEAAQEADKIISAAKLDAERITEQAQRDCEAIAQAEAARCEAEAARLKKRYASARASKRRNELLKAKQALLDEAVEKAYTAVTSLSDEEYEQVIIKLLKPRMRAGECVIYFPNSYKPSKKLRAQIGRLAEPENCRFTISHERAGVDTGFVLVYGGIEENCTFSALFEEKRGEIYELAAQQLLRTEEDV